MLVISQSHVIKKILVRRQISRVMYSVVGENRGEKVALINAKVLIKRVGKRQDMVMFCAVEPSQKFQIVLHFFYNIAPRNFPTKRHFRPVSVVVEIRDKTKEKPVFVLRKARKGYPVNKRKKIVFVVNFSAKVIKKIIKMLFVLINFVKTSRAYQKPRKSWGSFGTRSDFAIVSSDRKSFWVLK